MIMLTLDAAWPAAVIGINRWINIALDAWRQSFKTSRGQLLQLKIAQSATDP
ncbi:MAG TPA: hypothetical protein VGV18_00540 [Verrucomicrobiae bacterium]|nr:hypothetical protein [Verrucomicrobiae bacterium]